MKTINKKISLGKVAYTGKTKRNEVELELTLKEREVIRFDNHKKDNIIVLSICGAIWDGVHHDHVSGGQNIDEVLSLFPTHKKVRRIHDIWKRYHLNDLKPGSQKQCALIEQWRKENGVTGWAYGDECKYLASIEMLTDDQGYKWGAGWYAEEIPEDVIKEVKQLFGVE